MSVRRIVISRSTSRSRAAVQESLPVPSTKWFRTRPWNSSSSFRTWATASGPGSVACLDSSGLRRVRITFHASERGSWPGLLSGQPPGCLDERCENALERPLMEFPESAPAARSRLLLKLPFEKNEGLARQHAELFDIRKTAALGESFQKMPQEVEPFSVSQQMPRGRKQGSIFGSTHPRRRRRDGEGERRRFAAATSRALPLPALRETWLADRLLALLGGRPSWRRR